MLITNTRSPGAQTGSSVFNTSLVELFPFARLRIPSEYLLHFYRRSSNIPVEGIGVMHDRPTHRSSTGHPGSAHSPDVGAWSATWLGDLGASSTGVERCAADTTGILISGPSPAGTTWLDQSSVARL